MNRTLQSESPSRGPLPPAADRRQPARFEIPANYKLQHHEANLSIRKPEAIEEKGRGTNEKNRTAVLCLNF
ncbi:hypothetical protein AOLI_G00181560 [Acnodon oligacanthus]